MEIINREPVPQAIQDVIQVTVDRAIAALIENGLLDGKLNHKKRDGKRRRSRSRSRSHSKRGKGRKRSSSTSSSSSSSDSDDEDNGKKGKGRRHGKDKRRRSSRSHSRGRHSRSRSKSRSKSRHHHDHGKKRWHRHHHDSDGLLPLYHHYFNCPCAWAEGDESGGSRKGKKHGYKAHKKHWKKFRCPCTDDNERNDKTKDDSDKETDLSKEFETLEVMDKDKQKSL